MTLIMVYLDKINWTISKYVFSIGIIFICYPKYLEIAIDFLFISFYFIIPYSLKTYKVIGINFEIDRYIKAIRARFFNKFWQYEKS